MWYLQHCAVQKHIACELHLIVRVQTDIDLEIPLVNLRKPLLDWLDLRDT